MRKKYILVIDSGLGGVNILKSLKETFVQENFVYVLDNKNCPYGNKSCEELDNIALKLICENMSKFDIKLIVFACNTLTSVTIDFVRKFLHKNCVKKTFEDKHNCFWQKRNRDFNIDVVGTEPPIKMVNKNEKTLIVATQKTIEYNKILNENFDNENFTFVALKDIAKLVDENFFDRRKIIESLKAQLPQNNYQNVVLGCTHYYYLENDIKMVLNNPCLKFFTATEGVTKRVGEILKKYNNQHAECLKKQNKKIKKPKIKIILTKHDLKLRRIAKRILKN